MKNGLIVVKNTLFKKIRNLIMKIFNIREKRIDSNIENHIIENIDIQNSNVIEESKANQEILENNILNELDAEEYNLESIQYFDIDENYTEPEIEFDYKERDKIAFFKMYENIKTGKLALKDLTFEDATKVIVLQEFEKTKQNQP